MRAVVSFRPPGQIFAEGHPQGMIGRGLNGLSTRGGNPPAGNVEIHHPPVVSAGKRLEDRLKLPNALVKVEGPDTIPPWASQRSVTAREGVPWPLYAGSLNGVQSERIRSISRV